MESPAPEECLIEKIMGVILEHGDAGPGGTTMNLGEVADALIANLSWTLSFSPDLATRRDFREAGEFWGRELAKGIASETEAPCVANLRAHQTQLDADGCMVGVSRPALDETLALFAGLLGALSVCRTAMIEYGSGMCGPHCEAWGDGPVFAEEIAAVTAAIHNATGADR